MTTVVIPVGPKVSNSWWLRDCLQSVAAQTMPATEVFLLDDHGPDSRYPNITPLARWSYDFPSLPLRFWVAPWRMGVAHIFNIGVALASYPNVFMLGSDDTLEPQCLELCMEEARKQRNDELGYYSVGVRYMDTGEVQTAPCHAALVTKALWQHTGGFPVEASSGAPDAALLSILFGHGSRAGRIYPVAEGRPLYNYRRHAETDTAGRGPWQGVILATRDLVTQLWRPGGLP